MKYYLDGFIYEVSNKEYIRIHENIFSIACDETLEFGVFYLSLLWRSIFWKQMVQICEPEGLADIYVLGIWDSIDPCVARPS